ncbi:tRNA dimethylallyltransferase-like [Macrosteles quadrilineatus]|uniref:tRNA dimethylallyltransferase-like n=1 Tax=Macrosteles quadrilineatus TaxID=74068 RepID=UPI0023E0C3FA|nr:tRNA dimethylallyltransferase-like [Macrosteles quadrilineatus]
MQVYKGLDIVTNKVTKEEQKEVPHHMIDYLGPGEPIKVVDFRDRALRVIDDLQQRRKVPVIAGGTYYYVESLLWNFLMDASPPPQKRPRLDVSGLGNLSYLIADTGDNVMVDPVEKLAAGDKEKLHQALQSVDPARANELHPNNVRKVIRSLQVVQSTGRRHSELIEEQRAAGGGSHAGPLRFPNSAILWITCQQDTLDSRLDARVDKMVTQGLVEELQQFHDEYNRQRIQSDEGGPRTPAYTLGIYQSIGFKEFHPYLMLGEEERKGKEGRKLLEEGVKLMKIATRQYARRQVKWIRKRFLCRGEEQVPPLYTLDGSNLDHWDSEVKEKAFSIVTSILDGSSCPVSPEPIEKPQLVDHTLRRCDVCDRLFEGIQQLEGHMKSMKHKRKLKKLSREENKQLPTEKTTVETSTTSLPENVTSDKT